MSVLIYLQFFEQFLYGELQHPESYTRMFSFSIYEHLLFQYVSHS